MHSCGYPVLWYGGVNVVGKSGANSHTAAADGERAELAATYVSLLWISSGETDVGVGVSVEKGI